MHEMLGNHYFLARNYSEAEKELESALAHNPSSMSIKKKLIICHITTNSIERALELFVDVITRDIYSIIKTDPIFDHCPCPQLVSEMENSLETFHTREKTLALGMLWLYCDITESLKQFRSLMNPDTTIQTIISQLQSTVLQLQTMR
jgi:hypothetical protein